MAKFKYNSRTISVAEPKKGETKKQWTERQLKAPAFKDAKGKQRPDAEKVLGEQYDLMTKAEAPVDTASTDKKAAKTATGPDAEKGK